MNKKKPLAHSIVRGASLCEKRSPNCQRMNNMTSKTMFIETIYIPNNPAVAIFRLHPHCAVVCHLIYICICLYLHIKRLCLRSQTENYVIFMAM